MHRLKYFQNLRRTLPHARNSVSSTVLTLVPRHQNSVSVPVSSFHRRARRDDGFEKALLAAMGMKNWDVCVTKDEKGNEVLTAGGRVTAYLRPGSPYERVKDRLVDPLLVENFGVYDIDDLSEGQLAEYLMAEEESPVYRLKKIGGKWIKVRVNPYELDD